MKKSEYYDVYWKFAFERQNIFFNKLENSNKNWTEDLILKKHKFTNVYRACDRISQYLIKNVIYAKGSFSDEDIVFRILLFKIFNKIETWELLEEHIGEIKLSTFDFDLYNDILSRHQDSGQKIYSAAYIMPSGVTSFGKDKKHQNHLKLLELMFENKITNQLKTAKSLEDVYKILLSYPTIGEFLAFQFAIDINYSEAIDFDEMSFVVAGPGAKRGIEKCFASKGNSSYEEIIKYMADNQEKEFKRLGLDFKRIGNRKMQLIDCQNIFCEVDKYLRVYAPELNEKTKKTRIKQKYSANSSTINYYFPPKWDVQL